MTSGMLETGLNGLQSYVEKAAETVAESRDVEAAESFAHLLTKVAAVASELRKAEAAERKAATEITKSDMLDAIRRMEDGERARFLREAQTLTAKRSGLA
jgi:hypothetical protein